MAYSKAVRVWRCLRSYERCAAKKMADAYGLLTPFVTEADISACWLGSGTAVQRQAFRNNFRTIWKITRTTATIGSSTVNVWLADQLWMGDIHIRLLDGCIAISDPICQILSFPSTPDPECWRD